MSTFGSHTRSQGELNINEQIATAISLGKLQDVKRLVTCVNVNNILYPETKCTALHVAMSMPYPQIVNYLLKIGGNYKLLNNDKKNCFDFGRDDNKQVLLETVIQLKDNELDSCKFKMDNYLHKYNESLRAIDGLNNLLDKSKDKLLEIAKYKGEVAELGGRLNLLNKEKENLALELATMKSKYDQLKIRSDESERAFLNMNRKK